MARFKRSARKCERDDSRGKVQVVVRRVDTTGRGTSHVKGSLSRSFTVADAKVSEVAAAIESALF